MPSSKRYYTITEVSEMLGVPATTLRWWEEVFPTFNPNRLPSGRRRFTREDVKMAGYIKELLHVKGLKSEAAIEVINKSYRKYPPRNLRLCRNAEDAVRLLGEVKATTGDEHAASKIQAVINYLSNEH